MFVCWEQILFIILAFYSPLSLASPEEIFIFCTIERNPLEKFFSQKSWIYDEKFSLRKLRTLHDSRDSRKNDVKHSPIFVEGGEARVHCEKWGFDGLWFHNNGVGLKRNNLKRENKLRKRQNCTVLRVKSTALQREKKKSKNKFYWNNFAITTSASHSHNFAHVYIDVLLSISVDAKYFYSCWNLREHVWASKIW